MDGSFLHTLILLNEENRTTIIDTIKNIQDKLKQISNPYQSIRSRYEMIMMEWVIFTIEGISWNIGIQLQEVLEEVDAPVIFLGSHQNSLSDLGQLEKGKFDTYIIDLLADFDHLKEFTMHFLSFTSIMDYCLNLWQKQLLQITDIKELQELSANIDYTPLRSMITERISDLEPLKDENQSSLDDFF